MSTRSWSRSTHELLAWVSTACVSACGGDFVLKPTVYRVDISPDQVAMYLGQPPVRLHAVARAFGEGAVRTDFRWSSSDTAVVLVDGGSVVGRKPGWATISASTSGVTGEAYVSVREAVVMISSAFQRIPTGIRMPLHVEVWHESTKLADQTFEWSSSNPSVAIIDSLGVLTALAPGAVRIDARSNPARATGSLTITVVDVSSIRITSSPLSLLPGENGTLSAEVLDQAGEPINAAVITWTSGNPSVASVTSPGRVLALSPGSAAITASSSGKTATTVVTVSRWPALTFSRIAAGFGRTCALDVAGQAYCWGHSYLGDGTDAGSSTLLRVRQGSLIFSELDVGATHSCGLTIQGQGYCWGWNGSMELGDGTTARALLPVPVSQREAVFTTIALGFNHSCALTDTGIAWCWGSNTDGQLGGGPVGTYANRSPQPLSQGNLVFRSISTSGFFTCALTATGEGYCWGSNGLGQFGDGTAGGPARIAPSMVLQDSVRFTRLVASKAAFSISLAPGGHVCGLNATGQAYCWGYNGSGGLGDSSTNNRVAPTPVHQGAVRFVQLAAGESHTCALTENGVAYCWGSNRYGALGIGSTVEIRTIPTPVLQGAVRFLQLSAGRDYTCAVAESRAVYCWGINDYWQLGDGTKVTRNAPVPLRLPP